jgi:hypothetical protein
VKASGKQDRRTAAGAVARAHKGQGNEKEGWIMAWWKLVIKGKVGEPTDDDFRHIASLVKQGYTEGELITEDDEEQKEGGQ